MASLIVLNATSNSQQRMSLDIVINASAHETTNPLNSTTMLCAIVAVATDLFSSQIIQNCGAKIASVKKTVWSIAQNAMDPVCLDEIPTASC